ncbi:hypothetical protein LR48_Vigan879s000700 [Vigna angularis]|uniref:Leucine-rich repeat-containing N-terminal plant-type domain-containing protein n=1 Tax=Phaseolus angularis TaxID=3914 RepID=A0A0L9THL1_PHAAN|nr:hypothetical protein LR48_Vigan879s000700 [Vigna angularis]
MASRSPPSSDVDPYDTNQMLNEVLRALQQQNVTLIQQNTIALQNLEAARVSAENARVSADTTQRQFLDVMTSGRIPTGPSSSAAPTKEWSLENFLQHHPAKFNGKCSPDEADQWLRDMERVYNAKRCPDENRFLESSRAFLSAISVIVRKPHRDLMGFVSWLAVLLLFCAGFECAWCQDDAVMNKLKKAINEPSGLQWNDPGVCKWKHVKCSAMKRVTAIQIGGQWRPVSHAVL